MAKKKLRDMNWMTTVAGILAAASGVAATYGTYAGRPDIAAAGQAGVAVFGAGGLIAAKDSNK